MLGSAPDPRIQNDFIHLANQLHSSHSENARLVLTYDEPLSHMVITMEYSFIGGRLVALHFMLTRW